jgi:multiple sugar transport system substrate-binding protein
MRRMRWAAALVALLFVLAACTGAAEEEPEAEEPGTGEQEGGDDSGPVTLTFSDWHLSEPVWAASLEEGFEQSWAEEHPDIEVELEEISYAEKETKYVTEIEAGAGPDVMHLQLAALQQFMEQDYLLDLGPFIDEEGGEEFTGQWYPETVEMTQRDGTQYALPGDYMPMVMTYNTQLLEAAGLDTENLPATWDEWLTYAQQLTDADAGTWGFGTIGAIDPGFELRVSPIIYSHGGQIINDDGTCSALHTPEAREAFTFLV